MQSAERPATVGANEPSTESPPSHLPLPILLRVPKFPEKKPVIGRADDSPAPNPLPAAPPGRLPTAAARRSRVWPKLGMGVLLTILALVPSGLIYWNAWFRPPAAGELPGEAAPVAGPPEGPVAAPTLPEPVAAATAPEPGPAIPAAPDAPPVPTRAATLGPEIVPLDGGGGP
jgi:hypothetical protein